MEVSVSKAPSGIKLKDAEIPMKLFSIIEKSSRFQADTCPIARQGFPYLPCQSPCPLAHLPTCLSLFCVHPPTTQISPLHMATAAINVSLRKLAGKTFIAQPLWVGLCVCGNKCIYMKRSFFIKVSSSNIPISNPNPKYFHPSFHHNLFSEVGKCPFPRIIPGSLGLNFLHGHFEQ